MKKALLLLNLGTPAEPTAQGLRNFYRHFFADPFVFDMNPVGRWLLRNLIIIPFRAPRTAKSYATIWMEGGSPLKIYADRLQENLSSAFNKGDETITVLNGMAYSEPFIGQAMQQLEALGITDIAVLPLFPQYSSATTASVFHGVQQAANKWTSLPNLHFIDDLYSEPAFIRAWSIHIGKHLAALDVDHVVFSYHGLPEKTIRKADENAHCEFGSCCDAVGEVNRYCYRAQCMATTKSIVNALAWDPDFYSVGFQSRFGRQPWIKPYLDEHLAELLGAGVKKVAVVTPSFVSDCLETIHEIGIEYKHVFLSAGGEEFYLLPNLNDEPSWFNAMQEIAKSHLEKI
jgi:protoporphyrin/coproporphyrin ferrochelatase